MWALFQYATDMGEPSYVPGTVLGFVDRRMNRVILQINSKVVTGL